MRNAGKQWVYHAIQDPNDAMSLEDLAAMDKEIAELRDSIATAKANEKLMRANLVSINATLSTEELRRSVSLLEMEKKEIVARLEALKSGNVKPVLPEEKEAVDKAWREWSRKASSREKICMELWALCTEEMEPGKTKEEFWVCVLIAWCDMPCCPLTSIYVGGPGPRLYMVVVQHHGDDSRSNVAILPVLTQSWGRKFASTRSYCR